MFVMVAPEHIVWDKGVADAVGPEFTSTVAVIGAPIQPLAVGVIMKVTVTGAVVVFINAPLMLPDPLAAIPVTAVVLFLVQLYVVPVTLLAKAMVLMAAPEQIVCDKGVAEAAGPEFTSTVAVMGAPVQPVSYTHLTLQTSDL